MGKKVKEKEESKLVSTPRIFPMDEVEYVHEFVSQYIAMTRIEYVAHDGNESEWDNVVINVFKSFYSDLQTGIEGLSTIIAPKEKGLDISTINFKDFEINLAEYNNYNYNQYTSISPINGKIAANGKTEA